MLEKIFFPLDVGNRFLQNVSMYLFIPMYTASENSNLKEWIGKKWDKVVLR
jgi:hypothetical protein